MKLGIMQPYFMPYIGYWQLMAIVDKYVVYDDVNYIKRGWINRNNILLNGDKHLFSIPQIGASQNKLISEVFFAEDGFCKFEKTLYAAYSKAPYFDEVMKVLKIIFDYEDKSVGRFLLNSFLQIRDYLDFDTEFILSSSLEKDNTLKGKDKIIHICELLGATEYYNAIGGQELYDKKEFREHGMELYFVETIMKPYLQYKNEFVPGLSIIDVLMFNGKDGTKQMLSDYRLI